jgi:uncharacterized YigZ family protein
MSQCYPVPVGTLESELIVKKSRFIACTRRVESREEAMAFLAAVKCDFPDARHHCWAYLLGDPLSAGSAAANDDGEPSGTAGKPILNVIRHKRIGDVMVVVARYFGGIKLGAGGLVRAYGSAAEAVLSAVPLEHRRRVVERRLECDFSLEQPLRHWAERHGARVLGIEYSERVSVELALPPEAVTELTSFCRRHGAAVRLIE